jgi:hypothetical protein
MCALYIYKIVINLEARFAIFLNLTIIHNIIIYIKKKKNYIILKEGVNILSKYFYFFLEVNAYKYKTYVISI